MVKIEKIELPNNEFYEGEVVNNKKHGKGTFTFSDGGKYIGDWQNDKRHGKGVENFPDGYVYDGEYKDDLKHGFGFVNSGDGNYYEGMWENGSPNGKGKLTKPDSSIYEGQFVDGLQEGAGKLSFNRDEKEISISGNWFKNFLHGKAEETEDEIITKYQYYYGEIVDANINDKVENKEYPIGHIYSGDIAFGKPEGYGSMNFVGGQFYQGDWENGDINGNGMLIDPNEGTLYYGEFKFWKPPNPARVYSGKSVATEGPYENTPRITEWAWVKKNPYLDFMLDKNNYGIVREHEIEGDWTKKILKDRLSDNFRGSISNLNIVSMTPNLTMSEEEFTETFNEFCLDNNRKGHFINNFYRTKSFVFDDVKEIKTGFSKILDSSKKLSE